ncbi:MAG TPA: hypothetical protein VNJ01_09385 [Bacteriovoracaceae bacterium]|nr:hypothetical protein [Bacteriovoracaceae bacterium]
MNALEKMFPSLALFSDLNWSSVTEEYESSYIDYTFPEYLQIKALDDDCPPYLFELAFYEQALNDAKTSVVPFPHQPGVYLNPTALFLSLEFDVVQMLHDATVGKIEVHEREHVLCVFRDTADNVHPIQLSEDCLQLLGNLEDGPQNDYDFIKPTDSENFQTLVSKGLVLDLLQK